MLCKESLESRWANVSPFFAASSDWHLQVAVPSDLPALDLVGLAVSFADCMLNFVCSEECGLVVRSVGFDILPFQAGPVSSMVQVSVWMAKRLCRGSR